MSTRQRVAAYGSSAGLVVAGAACGAAISGAVGQVLAFTCIGLGLITLVSLVFLEIGLSEDRERAAEQRRKRRPRRRPMRKLDRSRGHPRRLD
jgi:hypothetical protein